MHLRNPQYRAWRAACLTAALAALALPSIPAGATPGMDGEKDAEYTLVAASPKDNLAEGDAAIPKFKSLDVTNLWAANTGTDLYLFIELPYLDLNTIGGEWAVVFHLRGANDALDRVFAQDPYGAPVDFNHWDGTVPGLNVILKSNMAGFANSYDGDRGYSFLNPIDTSTNPTGWNWETFVGNDTWTRHQPSGVIEGADGTKHVVYKQNKGIEVRIPLVAFGGNPSNTPVRPPALGDVILMQFYDNVREPGGTNLEKYPRGTVDAVPFEDGVQSDPTRGILTKWASYTLTTPPVLELGEARLVDATDINHITLVFSEALGISATNPANYAVKNVVTGAAVPVTAAAIDPNDPKRVNLTLTIPFNAGLGVTVSNVQAASGSQLSTTKNTGSVPAYSAVQFNLRDPYGISAGLGTNPGTNEPYKFTVTGDPISWRNSLGGANEIPLNPAPGQPGRYQSPIVLQRAGVFGFKYRIPEIPDGGAYDGWNGLNPSDRRGFAPATSEVFQITDNGAGTVYGIHYYGGDTVRVNWTLIDRANITQGRPVYITGEFNNWNADPTVAIPMTAVNGQPGTYTASFDLPEGRGYDTTTKYKYIIKPDPTNDPGATLWDELNMVGGRTADRFVEFHAAAAGQPAQVMDVIQEPRLVRVLRTAAGLDPAPQWSEYYTDQDVNLNGVVNLADVVRAARP